MSTKPTFLGFTNTLQQLVWPSGTNIPVTAYLWGGGGGAGGVDDGQGGNGSGGGFTEVNFLVSAGDVIDVAVGGAGRTGSSGRQPPGGLGGASYNTYRVFDTRAYVGTVPTVISTNSRYVPFLNTFGVWRSPVTATNFDISYAVNFPIEASYTFTTSADNSADFYLDGILIGSAPGYQNTYTFNKLVTPGLHVVRIIALNTGGPGSVALTIDGVGYSGGTGGNGGPAGASGAGGGGGGATVLFKNNVPLAVAAGGGGGGGGGRVGDRNGDSAPGTEGQSAISSLGQNGQKKSGDGGGGGGGGGGLLGGNGGLVRNGDQGAKAGANGTSSIPALNPSGRTPGGRTNPYYTGSTGRGGSGSQPYAAAAAGAAVLLFDVPGVFVKHEGSFQQVNDTWIKHNNQWQEVQAIYVKSGGAWQPVLGSSAPAFQAVSILGTASRSIADD
jgi:hypothetical protein